MVIWSKPAREDLKNIFTYIFLDSPVMASKVRDTIIQKVAALAAFPEMGRVVPEREDVSFRELLTCSYRIVYAVRGFDVVIVTIFHAKRDFTATFESSMERDMVNNH